jgi:sugar O-acyltransferase (sialic acid O-acetyltransferase NeuD family)
VSGIVIIGASGHARVVIDIVEKQGQHRIAGLLDRNTPRGQSCFGYEILGVEADLQSLGVAGYLIGIGDNATRAGVAALLESCGVQPVTAIHPSAQLARGVVVGPGTVVMAGAILNSNAKTGRHCILNTKSSLDHDSEMADFSSLGPNVTIGGNASVGAYTAVAISATLLHRVSVGAHSVIGAGSTVLHDIPDRVVAYGSPARVIRSRQPGDPYL